MWEDAISLAELKSRSKVVVRRYGRQILLVASETGVYACANRCPHEGYPLSEGVLTDGSVLTCNWHNWKFDLESSRTIVGGDRLRRFDVRIENGRVLIDLTPEDPAQRRAEILAGLARALEDADEARLLRETARLAREPEGELEAVRSAILWAAERLEFGTTHAIAGAPDWLNLHDNHAADADERLAAIGEILGHIAEDARGEASFRSRREPPRGASRRSCRRSKPRTSRRLFRSCARPWGPPTQRENCCRPWLARLWPTMPISAIR